MKETLVGLGVASVIVGFALWGIITLLDKFPPPIDPRELVRICAWEQTVWRDPKTGRLSTWNGTLFAKDITLEQTCAK